MNNKHRYLITNGCLLIDLKFAVRDFEWKTLQHNLIKAMFL